MAGPAAADPFNFHNMPLSSQETEETDENTPSQGSGIVYPQQGGFVGPNSSNPGPGLGVVNAGFAGLTHGNLGLNTPVGLPLALMDVGDNPVVAGKLQLNGHDRFSEREGRYFNLVQPYQHHENVPATGINVYSFGLKPEEHQPSGTCNMSRIDNATLHLTLTRDAVYQNRACKVRVYATNYNVLRIMSGMGGLAYSN
jgi:hypothetical protein